MISKAEIEALDWVAIVTDLDFPTRSYILYHTDYIAEENFNYTTLTLKADKNWLVVNKGVNTYFGKIANSTELQTIMTDFDIP
jgi:hypothetical protein